jgi:hypothetical protein
MGYTRHVPSIQPARTDRPSRSSPSIRRAGHHRTDPEAGFARVRLGWEDLGALLVGGLALFALGLFVRDALTLVAYPFDWDPGEGLVVDAALRLRRQGLASLYPVGNVVPAPFTYGPLLPGLLALLAPDDLMLMLGRWLGMGFALAGAAAVYALVRARASRSVALAFAALSLSPPGHHFYWLVLVRVDAAMIACWLWAAVLLMPPRLERGSATLGWRRAAGGGLLLVLATLAKPTALILGAPLVLAWFLVDHRSAWRASSLTLLLGGLAFAGLEAKTHGGFWRTLMLQTLPGSIPGQTVGLVKGAFVLHKGAMTFTLLGLVIAWRRRDGSLRDGAWLLWLAGPLTLPTFAKAGASFNYILPWVMGQAALAGRLLGPGWRGGLGQPAPRPVPGVLLGGLPTSLLALALSLDGFPLPTATDQRTAESFYTFIAARGGPLLAVHPDLAYVYAGEPVLVEMMLFPDLYKNDLPGSKAVFERLDRLEFRTVVENLDRWSLQARGYSAVGRCQLRYHFGAMNVLLMVPAAEAGSVRFWPLPGARCLAARRSH